MQHFIHKKFGTPLLACGLCLASFLSLGSCQQADTNKKGQKDEQAQNEGQEYITTASGKRVPKPEKGITVVMENGWSEQQMSFHLNYCEQMLASAEEVEAAVFCQCFLEKIQYFYEPRYFKEAYEDQQKWNAECIELARQ